MVIATIAIGMASFHWVDEFGLHVIWQNQFAFYAYFTAVLFIVGWTVSLTGIAVLRIAFRITGMMTRDEAEYYPLRANTYRVDPWPENWQKSDVSGEAPGSGPTRIPG